MDRRMQTARTGLLRIICGLLVIAVGSAAQAEFVWQNVSGGIPGPLGYNQERRIVRDADNGYLHVTFDNQGAVWYSWSEDNGATWLPDVPPPDNNREEIEGLGMTHGYGAIGVDRANTPWTSWVYGGQIGVEVNKLVGGIRTGGTWQKGELLSAEYTWMDQGAIAVSKCDVPTAATVAYSVVPAERYNLMGPTGDKYLFLVAWGWDEDEDAVRSFQAATLDYQFLPNDPHVLRASITVERYAQSDIIHVVWQRREDNTTRIYHVESDPITPQQVRLGVPLQWSDWFPVSQSQQQPVTEPATFPSVDFWDKTPNRPKQLIVAWHGPDNEGRPPPAPGDVWRRIRFADVWLGAQNMSYSEGGPSPVGESEYPEPSTPDAVSWEQRLPPPSQGDILGNLWGQIDWIVQRDGEDKWPHLAARAWEQISILDCHTLWCRPAQAELHYKLHQYIPRISGPGRQSEGWVSIETGEAYLYPVAPVGAAGTALRYFVPSRTWVDVSLFDRLGRRTTCLTAGTREPGLHELPLSGLNLPAGSYVCVLKTTTSVKTRPVQVLK